MRPPVEAITPETIRTNVSRVRARVEHAASTSGRSIDDVRILAAVKYVDSHACAHLVDAGVRDLAENRRSQLQQRQDGGTVPSSARWHFIGRLQSREAADIAARVSMVHTLCTSSAAHRLASTCARPDLLVQVNVADDPSKDGLAPEAVERFLLDLPEGLVVSGFMAMPALARVPEDSRAAFSDLRDLRDRLAPLVAGRHPLRELSIGTSQDFEVAVEEGATLVRLGRILYAGGE